MAKLTVQSEENNEEVAETAPEEAKNDTVVNLDARSQEKEEASEGPSKVNNKEAKINEEVAQITVEREHSIEMLDETDTPNATYNKVVNFEERSEKEKGTGDGPLKTHTKENNTLNTIIGEEVAQAAVEIVQISEALDESETETSEVNTALNLDETAGMAVEPEELQPDLLTPILKTLIMNIGLPTLDIYLDIRFIRLLFPDHWGCGLLVVTGILANFLFTALVWSTLAESI